MVDTRFYEHLGPVSLAELLGGLDAVLPEGQFGDIQISGAGPLTKRARAKSHILKGPNPPPFLLIYQQRPVS